MNGRIFDDLMRVSLQVSTRRGALGLLAGTALGGLTRIESTEAKKGHRKMKRRGKKKKGGGIVVVPPAAGCASDAQCGAGRICQGGSCVTAPPPPECSNDDVCGLNETCQNGGCICPEVLQDRCVNRCSGSADCPAGCGCRGLFPGDGQPRVVCVDESGDFCNRPSCDATDDCAGNAICVFTTCGSTPTGAGRCLTICGPDD